MACKIQLIRLSSARYYNCQSHTTSEVDPFILLAFIFKIALFVWYIILDFVPYSLFKYIPAVNYMFKVNKRNTRTRCEICSKLTMKTPELRQNILKVNNKDTRTTLLSISLTLNILWCHSGVFIVNFEDTSHVVLVFLLLTLSR